MREWYGVRSKRNCAAPVGVGGDKHGAIGGQQRTYCRHYHGGLPRPRHPQHQRIVPSRQYPAHQHNHGNQADSQSLLFMVTAPINEQEPLLSLMTHSFNCIQAVEAEAVGRGSYTGMHDGTRFVTVWLCSDVLGQEYMSHWWTAIRWPSLRQS